ncbi:MAG: GAF domain-containing protein [Gemmatimonadetes bacterium]|nr:MAG: GAF domain-containing protein [Gemmatimonadota bacterium]
MNSILDQVNIQTVLNDYAEILQMPLALLRPNCSLIAVAETIPFTEDVTTCHPYLPTPEFLMFQDDHDRLWTVTPLSVHNHSVEGYLVSYEMPPENNRALLERVNRLMGYHLVQLLIKDLKIHQKEQELTHRYEELEFLYEVGEVLNNIFDVQEATQRILSKAMEVLKVDKGSVMLVDKQGEMTIFASKGIPAEIARKTRVRPGEGISGKVLETGEPMFSENIEQEVYYQNKAFKQYRSGTFMSLPISLPTAGNKRKILGVLNLNDKINEEPFHANDLKLAGMIATQAAIFIENAQNYENILNEKKKFETILTGMGDGVIVTDEKCQVILINNMARKLLELPKSQGLGDNFYDIIAAFQLSLPLDYLRKTTTETLHYEVTIREHPLRVCTATMTRIYDKDQRLVNTIVLLHDITVEKTQELMKTEFLSLISHKLRTPLVGLVGYPQFLLDETLGKLNDQQRQAIETIGKQSQYLTRLVDQLLRFTELESQKLELHIEAQHPYLLLKAAIDENMKTAKQKQIDLQLDAKNLPPFIYVDGERVIEILTNLINNAIKFSPENSVVQVSAEKLNAEWLEIRIKDNGIGIEAEHLELIFERFYQVEEYFTGQIEGVGLGLSVVKHLVEAHQGKVWTESVYGKGSTFFVHLPISRLKSLAKYDFDELDSQY